MGEGGFEEVSCAEGDGAGALEAGVGVSCAAELEFEVCGEEVGEEEGLGVVECDGFAVESEG